MFLFHTKIQVIKLFTFIFNKTSSLYKQKQSCLGICFCYLQSAGSFCRLWVRILPSAHSSSPPPPSPTPQVTSGQRQNVQTLGYPWLTLGLPGTKITASGPVLRLSTGFCHSLYVLQYMGDSQPILCTNILLFYFFTFYFFTFLHSYF